MKVSTNNNNGDEKEKPGKTATNSRSHKKVRGVDKHGTGTTGINKKTTWTWGGTEGKNHNRFDIFYEDEYLVANLEVVLLIFKCL